MPRIWSVLSLPIFAFFISVDLKACPEQMKKQRVAGVEWDTFMFLIENQLTVSFIYSFIYVLLRVTIESKTFIYTE